MKKEKYLDQKNPEFLDDGLYALMKTSKGEMLIKFYDEESPVTTANFIGLAEGKIPNSAKDSGIPFYDGLIFHRIIKDFMIQGGDPLGSGRGEPGYKFDDEKNNLKHEGKGILSMANSGPNSNGSQFFITHIDTPWLDGKHTIFGKLIEGLNVVDEIANSPTDKNDQPSPKILIDSVTIIKKGQKYNNYDAAKFFKDNKDLIVDRNLEFIKKEQEEINKKIETLKSSMQKVEEGVYLTITQKGEGKKAEKGNRVSVHYTGKFLNGQIFDSSYSRKEPFDFILGQKMVIEGWEIGVEQLREGDKASLLLSPSKAYGEKGAGGVIPPNSWLTFEVELLNVK